MNALISFCNQPVDAKTNLLLLDLQSGKKQYLLETTHSFTGLAQDKKYYYALSQNTETGIVIIDKKTKGPVLRQKLKNLVEAHSIVVDGNNIYAVSTGNDRILQYNFDQEKMIITLEKTLWIAQNSAGESDTHHINAIFLHNNDLYISAFGPRENERWSSAKEGYVFNITKNRKEKQNIYHPHSVFINNNCLGGRDVYFCESSSRSIWKNDHKILVLASGYVRGLLLYGKYLVLGTSSGRKVSRNNTLVNNPADPGELENDCRILIFKKNIFQRYVKINEFPFLPKHKEIYDILIAE